MARLKFNMNAGYICTQIDVALVLPRTATILVVGKVRTESNKGRVGVNEGMLPMNILMLVQVGECVAGGRFLPTCWESGTILRIRERSAITFDPPAPVRGHIQRLELYLLLGHLVATLPPFCAGLSWGNTVENCPLGRTYLLGTNGPFRLYIGLPTLLTTCVLQPFTTGQQIAQLAGISETMPRQWHADTVPMYYQLSSIF